MITEYDGDTFTGLHQLGWGAEKQSQKRMIVSYSHSLRIACNKGVVGLLESGE